MKKVSILAGVIAVLFMASPAQATTWYVHPDSALNSIQAGLDSCSTGDTVLVAAGIYIENDIVWPNTQGIDLVSEYGDDTTVINGNSAGRVIACTTGVDSTTIISGFTIQNGNAYTGGGIFCDNSSPSLENVTISGNNVFYDGGGIYCRDNSNPILTNVTISGNTAEELDAGHGGGICCSNSSPNLTNVTIIDNTAGVSGGGIWCRSNSNPILTNITISGNTANAGGGIFCDDNSSPSLENVTISGNNTNYAGGGIFCWNNSSPSLANVTISGNWASDWGGGIYCCYGSSPSLVNCILWNDAPDEIDTIGGSIVTATYSDIQGGWPGTGNIDEDPVFVSGPLSDYHLCPFTPSPCIDAGNPDPMYNDPENPLIPGYAMWPALGTVRNDMGVYGGPGTEVWATGIEEHKPIQQVATTLKIFPNPFSTLTKISFGTVRGAKSVVLKIYDATGRVVKEFNHLSHNQIFWNGTDESNRKLPSGVYFLKFQVGDYSATEKLLLIR